jgi:hypothetical protein
MSPEEQEAYIAQLRMLAECGASRGELDTKAREMAESCRVIAEQAERVYRRYLELTGCATAGADGFAEQQLGHWAEFLASTARPLASGLDLPDHRSGVRALYLSWQFPSYPRFLGLVGQHGWLVLVAENRDWIESVVGPESTCNFRERRLSSRLPRALARGCTAYAMMDYCYPESSHVVVPFLGLPARTPTGLIKLASRYGYTLHVVSADNAGITVVLDSIAPEQLDPEPAATRINQALGREILRDPPRWLNWAMADQRWTVDFWPGRRVAVPVESRSG